MQSSQRSSTQSSTQPVARLFTRSDYRHNPRRNRSRRSVAPIVGHPFTWRNRRRDRWRDRLLRSIAATIAPCEHLMRVTVGGIRLGFRSALLLAQVLGFFFADLVSRPAVFPPRNHAPNFRGKLPNLRTAVVHLALSATDEIARNTTATQDTVIVNSRGWTGLICTRTDGVARSLCTAK